MDVKQLIDDLEKIRQECSDKMIDLDEADEKLQDIIDELRNQNNNGANDAMNA